MKTKIALISVFLLLLAFHASSTVAAGKNGCLICHTSDATLKLLYKPPVMGAAEGEG
jgi:hypothetical protein